MSENLNKNPYPNHEPVDPKANDESSVHESEFSQDATNAGAQIPTHHEVPQNPYHAPQGYNPATTHNDFSSSHEQPQTPYPAQGGYSAQYPSQQPQQGQYAPQGQYTPQGGYNQPQQGLYAAPQPGMAGYAPPLPLSTQKSNELSYWSLGIFGGGFVLSFMMLFWLVPITSIVGIVLSRKAQTYEQTSLATTSFWLNVAGLVLSLMASLAVFFFIFLIAASSGGNFH